MLIEFSVGNYRSFKEKVTFSMVAANLVSQDKNLDINNVFAVDKELSLIKSAAIYGANASGKSNLAKALQFMKWFMVNSSKETQSTEAIEVEKFRLSTETDDQPSFFEIVFLLDGQQHRYGFTADREKVRSEWLYYVPKTRETKLFDRQGDKFNIAKVLKADGIAAKTRSNALFLSVSAQFNIKKSELILNWLTNQVSLISGINDKDLLKNTVNCLVKEENINETLELLGKLDLGFTQIQVKQIKIGIDFGDLPKILAYAIEKDFLSENSIIDKIITIHQKFDNNGEEVSVEEFDLAKDESDGTQKVLALVSLLIDTLYNRSTHQWMQSCIKFIDD